MKLVTFQSAMRGDRVGALVGHDAIIDLADAALARGAMRVDQFATMAALIEAGERALGEAHELIQRPPASAVMPAAGVKLKAPLPLPAQIRDFCAFELHVLQAGRAIRQLHTGKAADLAVTPGSGPPVWYRQPLYYKCNRFAVAGPGDDVIWPDYSQLMDYELELACVIGRRGRDIEASRAREHIFGYTIFNDFSARDAQASEMEGPFGPAKGKDFDGANVFGPCIVTRDEIPDPYALTMRAAVNGSERVRGSTATMHWTFEQMIEHVSRGETLYPGEIFGSGTVGNGCGLESLSFLSEGDVVELEIERIGTLRNRVVRSGAV